MDLQKQINYWSESSKDDLMVYQLEGRYPERFPPAPSKTAAIELLTKTNDLHKWLINKL